MVNIFNFCYKTKSNSYNIFLVIRWIPITYAEAGGDFENTKNSLWMSETEKSIEISNLPNADKAVIFNIQETGYYRVNYDKQNWELIIKQLNEDHTKIHVINRAQIIDDAINLARSGIIFCEYF